MRFECGSVQMNPASISRTLFNPLSFLRHIANSSLDSGSAIVHVCGGERNRSQLRQNASVLCFGIPSVMSTLSYKLVTTVSFDIDRSTHEFLRQGMHKLAEFGSMSVPTATTISYISFNAAHIPQSAHNTLCIGAEGTNSILVVVVE